VALGTSIRCVDKPVVPCITTAYNNSLILKVVQFGTSIRCADKPVVPCITTAYNNSLILKVVQQAMDDLKRHSSQQ
jgi:hypothetical protein